MNADVLLADLRHRGVELVVDGDRLRCRPGSLLTDQDLEAIRENKPAIIDRLAAPPSWRRVVCFACRGRRFWQSVNGSIVCDNCHPPGSSDLVARWIEADVD